MSDAHDPPSAAPPQPAKRRRLPFRVLRAAWRLFSIVSAVVMALALLVGIFCVYTNWRGAARMRAALQALEEHGIDAQMQAAWFREPPDEGERDDGGARYWHAALALLPEYSPECSDLPYVGIADHPGICEPLAPEMVAAVAAYLERKRDCFQALAKAREHPEPEFRLRFYGAERNGTNVMAKLREMAHHQSLVSLAAQSEGNAEAACDACEATLDLSRASAREFQATVQMRRAIVLHSAACDQIEQILSRMSLTPDRLRSLREKFLASGEDMPLRQMAAVELADLGGTLRFLGFWWAQQELGAQEALASRTYMIPKKIDGLGRNGFVFASDVDEAERTRRENKTRLALNLGRLWVMACPGMSWNGYSRVIDLALKDYEGFDAPDHVIAERAMAARGASGDVSAYLDLNGIALRLIEGKARCRVAAAALAVEAYRLKNGTWPGRLSEMEGAALLDPFTGKPLKYRRTEDGVLIYTVGRNLIDEGGDAWHPPVEDPAPDTDDRTVQLFDPEKRNVKRPEGPLTR